VSRPPSNEKDTVRVSGLAPPTAPPVSARSVIDEGRSPSVIWSPPAETTIASTLSSAWIERDLGSEYVMVGWGS